MAHLTTPLPQCISAGSDGSIGTAVDIIRNPSGHDVRIQRRSESLRKFNIAYNLRRQSDLDDILAHFEVCEGPLHTFPLNDRLDRKSCSSFDTPSMSDVSLGTGDGATAAFPLRKGYTRGPVTKYRTILLPDSGSVLIAVNGVLKTITTHYTVNLLTGIVTFTAGNIPTLGQAVTAGFTFKCKVRFDTNDLTASYEGFRVGQTGVIPVIEVRS